MTMKVFGELDREDYRKLGFRCGLEVHQQLRTRKKLFCRCPNTHGSNMYDAELLRHMRPTLSELGEYDRTALMEFKTRKEIFYRINRNTVCTYEMDDTPPFPMNEEALKIALELSTMLGARIVDELHVARKQYLDGSIPTGFQRTALLSLGGEIPVGDKIVQVRQLSIEEDSCRLFSDSGHNRVFMTDRLSIPLIEIVTEPELLDPWEAKEAGETIRRLTRASGKVLTGAGAARQDVNVSVSGGCRVEIKGVHSLKLIPALCHYEAVRQKALLDLREFLMQRGLSANGISGTSADVTAIVQRSNFAPIKSAVSAGRTVLAVKLEGFQGVLERPIMPGTPFFWEFEGVVRVIACLDRMPNIIFNDRANPLLSGRVWERIERTVEAGEQDAVLLVWGSKRDCETAAAEIIDRAKVAFLGVPPETRQALPDGRTTFRRVLPGPERMYPDTDLPPREIAPELLQEIRAGLPERPWDAIVFYEKLGLRQTHARQLFSSVHRPLFDGLAHEPGMNCMLLGRLVLQEYSAFARRTRSEQALAEARKIVAQSAAGRIQREAVIYLLKPRAGALPSDPTSRDFSDGELRTMLGEALAGRDWMRRDKGTEFRLAMGMVMPGLRGRVSGARVSELLRGVLESLRGEAR